VKRSEATKHTAMHITAKKKTLVQEGLLEGMQKCPGGLKKDKENASGRWFRRKGFLTGDGSGYMYIIIIQS